MESISELWINVQKSVDGRWKISGVRELSKFESDWATGEPKNQTNISAPSPRAVGMGFKWPNKP